MEINEWEKLTKNLRLCLARMKIKCMKSLPILCLQEVAICIEANTSWIRISCNMGMRDLPDMYARSPRAAGPRAEAIHIRQIPSVHVTTDM